MYIFPPFSIIYTEDSSEISIHFQNITFINIYSNITISVESLATESLVKKNTPAVYMCLQIAQRVNGHGCPLARAAITLSMETRMWPKVTP